MRVCGIPGEGGLHILYLVYVGMTCTSQSVITMHLAIRVGPAGMLAVRSSFQAEEVMGEMSTMQVDLLQVCAQGSAVPASWRSPWVVQSGLVTVKPQRQDHPGQKCSN